MRTCIISFHHFCKGSILLPRKANVYVELRHLTTTSYTRSSSYCQLYDTRNNAMTNVAVTTKVTTVELIFVESF
jgi:cystathionine beta-lyase/cystathionine gamma-synthase